MLVPRTFDNRRCFLGESPRRDPEAARLVWIDILAGRILTRSLHAGSRTSVTAGGRIGGIALRADGLGYVIGQERAIRVVDPGGIVDKTLVERVPGDGRGLRTNELAINPAGRVVFGTMTGDRTRRQRPVAARAGQDLLDQPAAGFVFVVDVPQSPAEPAFYPG